MRIQSFRFSTECGTVNHCAVVLLKGTASAVPYDTHFAARL